MKIDPNAPAYPQPWMTTGRDSDQYGGLTIRAELDQLTATWGHVDRHGARVVREGRY